MKTIAVLLTILVAVSANPFSPNFQSDVMVGFNRRTGSVECRRNCGRAFEDCPPTNCVLPPPNRQCPVPVCNLAVNRVFVFPSPDPTKYYQCSPILNADRTYGFEVLERDCGCQTLFSYAKQACVHPADFTSDCNATSNPPPAPKECRVECPTC
jgi:hypothetical protein